MPLVSKQAYAIDTKGRIAIPATMRRAAGSRKSADQEEWYVLLPGLDEGCLWLYGPEGWQRIEEQLRRVSLGSAKGRLVVRRFLEEAHQVTADAQGRITIPSSLMDRARLGREAVVRGLIDHIEIWNPSATDRNMAGLTDADFTDYTDRIFRGEVE